MIDIIITKFILMCFKMAESFENLDNINKVQKSLVGEIEQVRVAGRRKRVLENDSVPAQFKILRQSQSAVKQG